MEPVDLLIVNGTILTMDEERRVISKGGLAVKGNRIVDLGPKDVLLKRYQAKKVMEAVDRLIMPGFVDAHVHSAYALARGMIEDLPCVPWCSRAFHFVYTGLDEESYYRSALLTCLQMVKTGTTCFAECGTLNNPPWEMCVVRAVEEVGLRGVVGRGLWDIYEPPGFSLPRSGSGFVRETTTRGLRKVESFIRRIQGGPSSRIKAGLALRQIPNCSDTLCRGVKRLSDEYGVEVLTHAGVAEEMVQMTVQRFGKRDIERMGHLGLLGPRFLAAHMGWISGEELMLIRDTGTHVVHNVGSSMHGAYGSVSRGLFPEMVSAGVNVALGCDAVSCDNHLDMVRQMYLAAIAHKECRLDPTLFPPAQVVQMATLNGAKALLWEEEIGSLEVGKLADVIIVDLKNLDWVPVHSYNLLNNLVYSATGESVETVIVDGRILMENRKILTVNEERLTDWAQEAGEKLAAHAYWLKKKGSKGGTRN